MGQLIPYKVWKFLFALQNKAFSYIGAIFAMGFIFALHLSKFHTAWNLETDSTLSVYYYQRK